MEKIKAEVKAKTAESNVLMKENSALKNCIESGRECELPKLLIKRAKELYFWQMLKPTELLKPYSLIKHDPKVLSSVPEDVITILKKMSLNPASVTRKEILKLNVALNGINADLNEGIMGVDGLKLSSPAANRLSTPLARVEMLHSIHPFSWHEVKEKVEYPSFYGEIENKDLQFLLETMSP